MGRRPIRDCFVASYLTLLPDTMLLFGFSQEILYLTEVIYETDFCKRI